MPSAVPGAPWTRADHAASVPPQPSAGNRPGERILLTPDTYQRPDAEILPLITPAAARDKNRVRRISHQQRARRGRAGERRPVAKRSTGL